MNRVIHFEIHATEPERAAEFYRKVFGWQIDEWEIPGVEIAPEDRYWLVTTGSEPEPGIDGAILARRGCEPAAGQGVNAYVCTICVESVDECLERALEAGGTLALPKMPVPGVGWLAYCQDTERNVFGMMQPDEAAQ